MGGVPKGPISAPFDLDAEFLCDLFSDNAHIFPLGFGHVPVETPVDNIDSAFGSVCGFGAADLGAALIEQLELLGGRPKRCMCVHGDALFPHVLYEQGRKALDTRIHACPVGPLMVLEHRGAIDQMIYLSHKRTRSSFAA